MHEQSENSARIHRAIARARARWLTSATINAGGRWAVLPAAIVALAGMGLALTGERSPGGLLALAAAGLAGVGVTLIVVRRLYARPAAAGAPDWTLLLDRTLWLQDALPTWCEAEGAFRAGMEQRIAAGLDPRREKLAAPSRHWAGLVIAVLLALMPLVFWQPAQSQEQPGQTIADQPEAAPQPDAVNDTGGGGGDGSATNGEGDAPGGDTEGDNGGDGAGEGETRNRPEGGRGETGAGEKPADAEPTPRDNSPAPENSDPGDNPSPEEIKPPQHEEKDIPSDVDRVKPRAADGDTRTETSSRWVYDPDGEKLDESTPVPRERNHPGEKAVPRTRMTRTERELIEKTYRKLYE